MIVVNHLFTDSRPIHFHSDDVSKPSSCSQLTFQESADAENSNQRVPKQEKLDKIVHSIRKVLRLGLFGVDVVVDQSSGRHAIIDVNSFPGIAFIKFEVRRYIETLILTALHS